MHISESAWYSSHKHVNKLPVAGLLLGLLYWFVDAIVHVYFLQGADSLIENLLQPTISQTTTRVFILLSLVLLGVYVRYTLNARHVLHDDLLRQNYKLEELIELKAPGARNRIETLEQEVELLTAGSREIERRSTQDTLTHIYNRRKFQDLLEFEVKRQQRYKHGAAILLFEIDHYEDILVLHGQAMCDHILRSVVKQIKSRIRETDIMARWNDCELILFLNELERKQAARLAEQICNNTAANLVDNFGLVTVSAGATVYLDGDTATSFITRVTEALMIAREQGGNSAMLV